MELMSSRKSLILSTMLIWNLLCIVSEGTFTEGKLNTLFSGT